jgi:hypothetical protein
MAAGGPFCRKSIMIGRALIRNARWGKCGGPSWREAAQGAGGFRPWAYVSA